MYIIVGLGNPGDKYENTRHNAGFSAIDAIADKFGIDVSIEKHKALIGKGIIEGNKVLLVKPLTYMNNSGESIREIVDYYKEDASTNLIVIYDDISLSLGQLRIRKKGSAGGHNGIKSIIAHLGSDVFMRIKMGVGEKPAKMDLADYVLGHFSNDEAPKMKEAYGRGLLASVAIMNEGPDKAMNLFN